MRLVREAEPAGGVIGRRLTRAGAAAIVAAVVVMWFGAWLFFVVGVFLGGFWDQVEVPIWKHMLFMLMSGLCLAAPIAWAAKLLGRRWLGAVAAIVALIPGLTMLTFSLG